MPSLMRCPPAEVLLLLLLTFPMHHDHHWVTWADHRELDGHVAHFVSWPHPQSVAMQHSPSEEASCAVSDSVAQFLRRSSKSTRKHMHGQSSVEVKLAPRGHGMWSPFEAWPRTDARPFKSSAMKRRVGDRMGSFSRFRSALHASSWARNTIFMRRLLLIFSEDMT